MVRVYYQPPSRNPPGLSQFQTLNMSGYGGYRPTPIFGGSSVRGLFAGDGRRRKAVRRSIRTRGAAGGSFGNGSFGNGMMTPSPANLGAGRRRRHPRRMAGKGPIWDAIKSMGSRAGFVAKNLAGQVKDKLHNTYLKAKRKLTGKPPLGTNISKNFGLLDVDPFGAGRRRRRPATRRRGRGGSFASFMKGYKSVLNPVAGIASALNPLAHVLKFIGKGKRRPARRPARRAAGGFLPLVAAATMPHLVKQILPMQRRLPPLRHSVRPMPMPIPMGYGRRKTMPRRRKGRGGSFASVMGDIGDFIGTTLSPISALFGGKRRRRMSGRPRY